VFNTSNTPAERELATYNDPLETLWKNNMLVSCGVKNFHRRTFGVIITSTFKQRSKWLREAAELTHRHFPKGPGRGRGLLPRVKRCRRPAPV
jgi:hypothetical protein